MPQVYHDVDYGENVNYYTVLCKRNEKEVRRITSFVLAKVRRNFAKKFRTNARELSLNDGKFRGDLSEISCLRKRSVGRTKFR